MLTTEQLTTLKAAIAAETDSAFVTLRTANDEQGMADFYNAASTKIVWRTGISRAALTVDGFDFTQVDNLTVGQARIWDWLFEDGPLNPSESGKRAAVSEAWKGTAAKVAVGTFVLGKCKRAATKGEALYATGTGTDGSPAVLAFEGALTAQNISDALRA
jgi:hypothetical protein